ncbi:MAG: DNA mismatch repair protein MutS [Erysipelotrichaceae bacterium]|nr:DNA mismatch repair protein MutS [Erysipelotrichaceae bacterium]
MEKKYTPMMMQYLKIKEKHPDTLILFRLGDFYELFFEDAKIASRVLQLTLTGKSAGVEERVPMCGVPHHAISSYIDKLIAKGYRVGIVEQLEDPSGAKGIVERDVVQIITPGANIDVKVKDNNYIGCIDVSENCYIFSYADVSTGEIYVENLEKNIDSVISEIDNLFIKEVVSATSFSSSDLLTLRTRRNVLISYENNNEVTIEHEYILNNVYDLNQRRNVVRLLQYLKSTQKSSLDYMKQVKVIRSNANMQIDSFSRNNLELIRTIRSEDSYGTLFWLLDQTQTNMGSRLLKKWISKPLCDLEEITNRQNIVSDLMDNFLIRGDLTADLRDIYDLERLVAKINFGSANGRDMLQLKKSLQIVPSLLYHLKQLNNPFLNEMKGTKNDFVELTKLLERSISEDAPLTVKEGGIFKVGYHETLDELITLSQGGKSWVASLEAKEKEKTGIKTLKVGYNRVFGYYIEVSKGQVDQVKEEWGYERKQTTINSERYITKELKEQEAMILNADEKRCALEYELFNALRKHVANFTEDIQELANLVSYIDCLIAFSEVSLENRYCRPKFNDERRIRIINGRHPVIEKVMKNNSYVPNDIIMDRDSDILVITGPNMGGKSTFMRQMALIVILAQIGCFVPCDEADLMIFDSIFTRIGASDDLVSGQSTFMVEMNETNFALRHASENSLLIFDEIGRGTATFDGMALAQAILEYIATKIRAKTLFSTHYHEITKIDKELKVLRNVHVSVSENDNDITFLYKVSEGAMGKSYGINVARLAKLPNELISRADEILLSLEANKVNTNTDVLRKNEVKMPSWVDEVKKIDPLAMSPLEALNFLYDLKRKMGDK